MLRQLKSPPAEEFTLQTAKGQSTESDSFLRPDGGNGLVKRSNDSAARSSNGQANGNEDEQPKKTVSCCTPRNMQSSLLIVLLLAIVCAIFLFLVGFLAIDKLSNYIWLLPSAPQRLSFHALLALGIAGLAINIYCFVAIFIKHTLPNYISAGLLSALVLLQLLLVVFLLVSSFTLVGPLHTSLEHSIRNEYQYENNSNNSARIQLLDILQIEQDCCGAASFRDWAESKWFRDANNESNTSTRKYFVPPSCCIAPQFNCGYSTNINNIKYGGCAIPLLQLWRPQLRLLSLVTFVLIAPDVAALLLLVFLLQALRRAERAEREEEEEEGTEGKQPLVGAGGRVSVSGAMPRGAYE